MRKLTFERAILIVLLAIIFIQTTEIREKFTDKIIDKYIKKDISYNTEAQPGKNQGFPTMFITADNLYNEGDYEGAVKEYLTLTLNNALSIEQRSRANFRLGICQYKLKSYQLAFESFMKASSLSPNDSIIYNNAAVSAYRANDMENAIKYQTKALDIFPVVEYYYNLARIYEDNEQYELAIDNYLLVAKAEQNLTKTDKIDPVRIKEKIVRLLSNNQNSVANNVLIAYKLKNNMNEILTINDNEMQIKPGDFMVKVENQKTTKSIIAEYDKKKYDPYNLITEVLWTVYKDGKQIYKKSSNKISFNTAQTGDYEIKLSIKYNGNKEMTSRKKVNIKNNQSTIGTVISQDEVVVKPPLTNKPTKTYEYAIYEQLFESDFDISNRSYTDKYNVVWGKDQEVIAGLMYNETMDKKSALFISNPNNNNAGLWINLDSYIKASDIPGKKIRISFYTKKMTETTVLDIKARLKMGNSYINIPISYELQDKWEQKSIYINTPQDMEGLTISITTKPNQAFKMDGFIIVD